MTQIVVVPFQGNDDGPRGIETMRDRLLGTEALDLKPASDRQVLQMVHQLGGLFFIGQNLLKMLKSSSLLPKLVAKSRQSLPVTFSLLDFELKSGNLMLLVVPSDPQRLDVGEKKEEAAQNQQSQQQQLLSDREVAEGQVQLHGLYPKAPADH